MVGVIFFDLLLFVVGWLCVCGVGSEGVEWLEVFFGLVCNFFGYLYILVINFRVWLEVEGRGRCGIVS